MRKPQTGFNRFTSVVKDFLFDTRLFSSLCTDTSVTNSDTFGGGMEKAVEEWGEGQEGESTASVFFPPSS